MTMLARRWLQLTFEQALQMAQALGVTKNSLERLCFTQQNSGWAGIQRTKGHGQVPGNKMNILTESNLTAAFQGISVLSYANQ
ncbi:hypothetical protein PSA5_29305 [Pseudomonas syringae pv. actinidiae]|nr:hypothetical protein PSA5_29305 [Pseudomonas syringae pv. actinidiae]